jgi:hypothetical protein
MSRIVPLTRGHVAIVDDEDCERLSVMSWTYVHKHGSQIEGDGYATHYYRVGRKVHATSMHKFLMSPPAGMLVDHWNGNGLDNRRHNLRVCTHAENMRNRKMHRNNKTGFKGVTDESGKTLPRFRSVITINKRQVGLGKFRTAMDAAIAYDNAARVFHGSFARPNLPPQGIVPTPIQRPAPGLYRKTYKLANIKAVLNLDALPHDHTERLLKVADICIPRWLPVDVREEAQAALVCDLLTGSVTEESLTRKDVRRYIRDAYPLERQPHITSLDRPMSGSTTLGALLEG